MEYYKFNSSDTTAQRIAKQEEKDRFLVHQLLGDKFKGTQVTCGVDGFATLDNGKKLAIEIKERNVTDEQFKQYPVALLKVNKLASIKKDNQGCTTLLFTFFQQQKKLYIFNLSTLDFENEISKVSFNNKITQFSDYSGYRQETLYSIPISKAIYSIDVTKQYNAYNNKIKK